MIKTNTFALLPPHPLERNAEQEIEWLQENYNFKKPLMAWALMAAYKQKIKRETNPEAKAKWEQVLNWLKSI